VRCWPPPAWLPRRPQTRQTWSSASRRRSPCRTHLPPPPPTPPQPARLATRWFGPPLGAKGDNRTDDTAAIQAALNSLVSLQFALSKPFQPATVYFPLGICIITKVGVEPWT
jgi:hypothetical protein